MNEEDTEMGELINDSKELYLNANEVGFLEWLNFSLGIRISFADYAPADEKWNVINFLKEAYWKEYIDCLEISDKAKIEKERK